ncbi:hypothetical protein [Dongia sp.]|uniref:hypothetical protein n=1 Tax=Dongia sp. TaxID=1977262 RepID=UPI0035AE3134
MTDYLGMWLVGIGTEVPVYWLVDIILYTLFWQRGFPSVWMMLGENILLIVVLIAVRLSFLISWPREAWPMLGTAVVLKLAIAWTVLYLQNRSVHHNKPFSPHVALASRGVGAALACALVGATGAIAVFLSLPFLAVTTLDAMVFWAFPRGTRGSSAAVPLESATIIFLFFAALPYLLPANAGQWTFLISIFAIKAIVSSLSLWLQSIFGHANLRHRMAFIAARATGCSAAGALVFSFWHGMF